MAWHYCSKLHYISRINIAIFQCFARPGQLGTAAATLDLTRFAVYWWITFVPDCMYSLVFELYPLNYLICIHLYLIGNPLYYLICVPLHLIDVPLYLICVPLCLICVPLYLICIPLHLMC